jgi:hypothetical protein
MYIQWLIEEKDDFGLFKSLCMARLDLSSLHPAIKHPETYNYMPWPGFEPRPRAPEAGFLPKSYLDSLGIRLSDPLYYCFA